MLHNLTFCILRETFRNHSTIQYQRYEFWEEGRILGRGPYFGKTAVFWEDGRALGRGPYFGKTAVFWEEGRILGRRLYLYQQNKTDSLNNIKEIVHENSKEAGHCNTESAYLLWLGVCHLWIKDLHCSRFNS